MHSLAKLEFCSIILTCGMYPTLRPGIPLCFVPGLAPNTVMLPESHALRPTTHESVVVLPQPLLPSKL